MNQTDSFIAPVTAVKAACTCKQARLQDLAAGGPKTWRRGRKPEGGHILKIQYWKYAATGGPNVKREGTDFKWGGRAPPAPPPARYGDCYLTSAWSAWSWSLLVIAASSFPRLTANGSRLRYGASRMASHRDTSWHPFSSQHLHLWLANHHLQ